MKVAELATMLGTSVLGRGEGEIESVAPFDTAGPHQVTFLGKQRPPGRLAGCRAGAIVVRKETPPEEGCPPLLPVDDPELTFFTRVVPCFCPTQPPVPGVDPTAIVAKTARLGRDVYVGPLTVIRPGAQIGDETILHGQVFVGEGVRIGQRCEIHPGVVLYAGTRLGDGVLVHGGTVIGADGFGYLQRDGRHVKIPQVGTVEIGDEVEIGANSCIDRGTMGATIVGSGTKIDNLVQISHNCRLGAHCIITGCCGIAGSSVLGEGVMLGAGAGISDHVTVGAGAIVTAMSGVAKNVDAGQIVSGALPARPRREHWRRLAELNRLGELFQEVRELRRKVESLEQGPPA